ncbi:MAG: arsinothricin resistance N-acetyltransferase ArsN1 family B [Chitinophagaceae bacterium]
MIRLATPTDAVAMLAIYAPYIRNTSITFETRVPLVADFANRIRSYLENWPWLVYEKDGQVVGYAYASRYRERIAYQWSIECSVYVQDDHLRSGVGKALYSVLFSVLKIQGFTTVYAVINLPNERSVAFHESMGFNYFATYEKVGYKLGKWKDVGWWQLQLNDYLQEPPAPLKLSAMTHEMLKELLSSK